MKSAAHCRPRCVTSLLYGQNKQSLPGNKLKVDLFISVITFIVTAVCKDE